MTHPSPTPLGGFERDLDRAALRRLVGDLAARPDLWRSLVRIDAASRRFEQLWRDTHVDVWVISWMHGHDTGFHDHDVSQGAVAVVDGALVEERMVLGGAPLERRHPAGAVFDFDASHVHRMRQDSPRPGGLDPRLLAAAVADGHVRRGAGRDAAARVDLLRGGAAAGGRGRVAGRRYGDAMSVRIATRADITLEAVRRVGMGGRGRRARARGDRAHGRRPRELPRRSSTRASPRIPARSSTARRRRPATARRSRSRAEAQARRPTRLWTAHAFGAPLPERVVRAIVLARLANFVDGHAAVRAEVASAVAAHARRRAAAGGPRPGQRRRRARSSRSAGSSTTSARASTCSRRSAWR